jgi:hypothetical protein
VETNLRVRQGLQNRDTRPSFPRRRESTSQVPKVDPRLRGDDERGGCRDDDQGVGQGQDIFLLPWREKVRQRLAVFTKLLG